MATTITTTTSTLSPEVRTAYDTRLLEAARPKLIFAQFGDKRPVPKNQGKFIQLRRFELLPSATVPLTEGVTPNGNTLTVTQVNLGVQQYGDFIQVSDVVTWVDIDPILTEGADILGEQAGKTLDGLARDYMNIGASVRYANGKLSRGSLTATDKINTLDIKKVVRDLEKASVPTINGSYVGIVSPDTALDITALPEWLTPQEYNSATAANGLFNNEIGSLYNIRFVKAERATVFSGQGSGRTVSGASVVSGGTGYTQGAVVTYTDSTGTGATGTANVTGGAVTSVTQTAPGSNYTGAVTATVAGGTGAVLTVNTSAGIDVHSTLIFGKNAFVSTEIEGEALQMIAKPLGSAGAADPLDQRATQGWKATFGGAIANDLFCIRLESAVTGA